MALPIYSVPSTFLIVYVAIALRFVILSGVLQWAVARYLGQGRRIAPGKATRMRAEIGNSLVASLFFAAAGTWIIAAFHDGGTRIYLDWAEYGWAYLPVSFVVYAFLHETYFYWTHRWMHWPRVFRFLHQTHHLSRNPTAFAAFSFHPAEAAVEALILPLLVAFVPVHYSVLALFLLFMTVVGAINHLGYEIFPAGFARHPLTRWWISPTHHQMHHELVRCNYGLYCNAWDRWLGTQHPGYEERFREVLQKKDAPRPEWDFVIAGGGLSGALAAFCMKVRRPEWRVLLIEKSARIGGNHTWSFHDTDLPPASREWVGPLITRSWSQHEVHFPRFERVLPTAYHSIRSEDFHEKILRTLGEQVYLDAEVAELGENFVRLSNGTLFQARAVLDARGAQKPAVKVAYQKFFGLDLELEEPHGITQPVLMDATVEQRDGYRFFYLLPWSETEVLVEDTRYSDAPGLDRSVMEEAVLSYARNRGWRLKRVARSEVGVLPIPLASEPAPGFSIGMRGQSFHDTTGYSLPDAVRVAELLAALPIPAPTSVDRALQGYRQRHRTGRSFLRGLNRMLFLAASPSDRVKVFEKFYRLPTSTIERFYRGQLKGRDYVRILSGKPPVPWQAGVKALFTRAAHVATGGVN